jgi:hypothetical protein
MVGILLALCCFLRIIVIPHFRVLGLFFLLIFYIVVLCGDGFCIHFYAYRFQSQMHGALVMVEVYIL